MDLQKKLKYYQGLAETSSQSQQRSEKRVAEELNARFIDEQYPFALKLQNSIPIEFIFPATDGIDTGSFFLETISKKNFPEPLHSEKLLFFDLETTGLSGGAGTYPFLQGYGFFEKRHLVVTQYFLTDYGKDNQVYSDLNRFIENRNILVSYNGKSYDYPLLKNRFIMNRMDDLFANWLHLDLLHLARRIWKSQIGSCSLENIERKIFQFYRFDDIDGALIPQSYFDYLNSGSLHEIKQIIDHNLLDIISLARLLYYISSLEYGGPKNNNSETEILALFRLAVQNNDLQNAHKYLDKLNKRNIKIPVSLLVEYSLFLKRLELWKEAITIWQDLLESGNEILLACRELAKYYEHRVRDYQRAKQYVERGLKYLSVFEEINPYNSELNKRHELRHRLNRIIRKIEKT